MDAIYFSDEKLYEHAQNEEIARDLAARLRDMVFSLRGGADPEDLDRYRQAFSDAEDLYLYQSRLLDYQDEMHLTFRVAGARAQNLLEDSIYECKRVLGTTDLSEI